LPVNNTFHAVLTNTTGTFFYIRQNNPTSAYAMHILNNRHEFGPAEETLTLR